MNLNVGTKLGRYKIRSKIGAGGMGEVYLAQDTELDRKVALKILPADLSSNRDRMERFVREAKSAAALNHPNIAHIYEIGEHDGLNFIAMEFIDGETLHDKIHRDRAPLAKLIKYLTQVAEGLAKAHSAGIVHRDLKPDNIMVTRDDYAKILDFGLAKLVEQQRPFDSAQHGSSEIPTAVMPQHSLPGMVMGTLGYMSPEQAQGRINEIDTRSDIFSFGCILYETVTGQKAFAGKDALDSLHKIVHAPTPQIKDFNPLAPDDLHRIVRRCLMKDPEKRYQSIKDVAIELEELLQELKGERELDPSVAPAATSVSSVGGARQSAAGITIPAAVSTAKVEGAHPTTSAEYIVSGIKRHRTVMVVAIVAIVVIGVGLAYGLYRFLGNKRPGNQARTIVRLTSSGKVGNASISPDGKYVAYSAFDEAGQSSLWVRHVATTSNVQIVPPAGMDVFFGGTTFSPDGNYIYYIRSERNTPAGVLYEVPVLGGTSKKVLGDVSRISFSPDGKRFAFERRYTSEAQDAVMVANADGTGEQRLAVRKHPEYFLAGVAWSPDGKTIACPTGGFTEGHYRSVAIIQVADGTQKPLTPHRWQNVERVAWLADGSGLITTAKEQRENQEQVWQISYPDGEAHPITNDLNTYHNVSLTADSSSLAVVLSDQTANIWVAPNGEWNKVRQLTSSKSNGAGATTWTPDGRIVFGSRASGNPDLWIMGSDGRNQKQLTDDAEGQGWPSVTSDGRYVVFASGSTTFQVWRMDIDGSNRKQLTTGIGSYEPHCSPDSKWVVYSTFGTNGFNLWKVSIDGGEPIQITNKYADLPAVSPDGKLIACYFFDEQTKTTKLALLPFAGGDPVQMFDLPRSVDNRGPGGQAVRWTPDGRALTYIVTRGGVSNIWAQPIDGSAPKQLTDFKTDSIFSFDWSRDGKQLACSRGPVESDVVLISNFK